MAVSSIDPIRRRKVAILYNKTGVFPEFSDVVSAHIQLPVHTSKLLKLAGCENITITTQIPSNQVMPNILQKLEDVLFVPNPNKQKDKSAALEGHKKGVYLFKFLLYLKSIYSILVSHDISILHVFGTQKFALSTVPLCILKRNLRIVWTTESVYTKKSYLSNFLISKYIKDICTTTSFVKKSLDFHPNIRLLHRGNIRYFSITEVRKKNRILFWRDPSIENGADIALDVYKRLANNYKNIKFTFAFRPNIDTQVELSDISHFTNIEIYNFPYKQGISLEGLLSESICAFFPFRYLSTNPQLAVFETLSAGIPVVCSSVESNQEFLKVADLDFQLSEDVDEYVKVLSDILDDYEQSGKLPTWNQLAFNERYNWDRYVEECVEVYQRS
jgi:glycosyltransferase involved in cell wall biosynthesis